MNACEWLKVDTTNGININNQSLYSNDRLGKTSHNYNFISIVEILLFDDFISRYFWNKKVKSNVDSM